MPAAASRFEVATIPAIEALVRRITPYTLEAGRGFVDNGGQLVFIQKH